MYTKNLLPLSLNMRSPDALAPKLERLSRSSISYEKPAELRLFSGAGALTATQGVSPGSHLMAFNRGEPDLALPVGSCGMGRNNWSPINNLALCHEGPYRL